MIKPTIAGFLIAMTSDIPAVVTLGQIIRGGTTESKVTQNFKDLVSTVKLTSFKAI